MNLSDHLIVVVPVNRYCQEVIEKSIDLCESYGFETSQGWCTHNIAERSVRARYVLYSYVRGDPIADRLHNELRCLDARRKYVAEDKEKLWYHTPNTVFDR